MISKDFSAPGRRSRDSSELLDRVRDMTLNDLMELHDEAFVSAAFELLLYRPVDPTGLKYYTERLRRGFARISVLNQLVHSTEARSDWRSIAGLADELERYRQSRSLSGWRQTWNDPELGRSQARRQERAARNALGAQMQLLSNATRQIRADFDLSFDLAEGRRKDEAIEVHKPGTSRHFDFKPPTPRKISQMRKADMPDAVWQAVGTLET